MPARARAAGRIPSRAQRRAGSIREPRAAILTYRLAVRGLAAELATLVRKRVLPLIASLEGVRTDASEVDSELETIERAMLRRVDATVGAATKGVADRTVKHSRAEFKRLGINLRKAEPKLDAQIERWRERNVAKITSLMSRELGLMRSILAEAEGRHVRALTREIEHRVDVTRSKAELFARDQTLKLHGQITQARHFAAGITEYIWTTSGDERVRETHADLDGERFSYDDPPVTNDAGDRNHPGGDYQCRCTAYPVLPELEEERTDAAEVELHLVRRAHRNAALVAVVVPRRRLARASAERRAARNGRRARAAVRGHLQGIAAGPRAIDGAAHRTREAIRAAARKAR
jgi:SPP1 gp7 family putative phage head morphogenesis protein